MPVPWVRPIYLPAMRTLASASSLHAPASRRWRPRLATEENKPRSDRGKKTEEDFMNDEFFEEDTGEEHPISNRRFQPSFISPLTPYARRCRAATLTLAPLRFARGWPPPLRPQPSRSRGWARPAPGAGLPRPAVTPAASTAGLRVELARGALARLCLGRSALGTHAGLCPSGKAARVKIGGVLRGVLPRSSALRASGGGARGNAVRGSSPRAQPRLRSALGLSPSLTRGVQSA